MHFPSKTNHFIALGIITLCTLAAYSGTFQSAFQFDDMYYVVNNAAIRDIGDLKSVWNATRTPIRFLTFLTFAANYHFHGYSVASYHVTNFLIHLANSLLVYWFVLLIFKSPRLRHVPLAKEASSIALFAALLFGVHPLMTQAVTYISQRFASLATLFYILSVCLYMKGRLLEHKKRIVCFLFCAVAMIAGMFSKQITITIPIMILACEFLLFDWSRKHNYRYALYFLPLLFLIPILYEFQTGFITSADVVSGNNASDRVTPHTYPLTQTRVILTYLKLFLIPLGQRLDYVFPVSHSIGEWRVVASIFALTSFLFLALRLRRRNPAIAFGILWFFIALSVESSIIVIKHVIFEHRMYLPSIGLVLVTAVLLHVFIQKKSRRQIACVVIIGIMMLLTFQRNKVWQTDFTLWEDNLKKEPLKARPYVSLGIAHIRKKNYDQALTYLNRAIELDATNLKAFHNRGLAHQEKHLYDLALKDYSTALELEGHKGVIYSNRGSLYKILGNSRAALQDYNKSIEINPSYAQVYVNRGVYFGERKRYDIALKDFNSALELYPHLAEALNNRGVVYQQTGRYDESLTDFNLAMSRNPRYAEALYNRGNTFKETQKYDQALADYNQAIQVKPNYAEAYNNQGIIFGTLNQLELALKSFNKAIEIHPNFSEAYYNRSLAYLRLKRYRLALEDTLFAQKLGKQLKPEYVERLESIAAFTEAKSTE